MSDKNKKKGGSREKDELMEDVKTFISSDDGGMSSDGDDGGADLDDLMKTKKGNASLVMFLLGLVIILGVLGYALVSEEARDKIAGFIRGDLFKLEKQRAEELQKLYLEKIELLGEKYGDIRLEYFPRDAKVHIYQTLFRYDDINDRESEEWGDMREIPNETLTLADGDELPYLSIENLPVREKGMMCVANGQFYPASQQFCPGFEKCREQLGKAQAEEGAEGEAAEAAPAPTTSEECIKNALKAVQFCPQDEKYYIEDTGGIMVCSDGKTLMDPAKVPLFVFRYDFLFERKDFLSQVISYNEADWIHLGSGKYIIQFPKDFALLRAWGPVKKKYAEAREMMRCWRLFWEDEWEKVKRDKVLTVVREKIAQTAKEKEEKQAAFKARREQYLKSLAAADVVRKVKTMSTIRNGMAEIFYYCPEAGRCDPIKMQEYVTYLGKMTPAELDDFEKGVYYSMLFAMKNPSAKWDGMDAWLAANPTAKAGLTCLQQWIATQKEGQFVQVKAKECTDALDALRSVDLPAYTAFLVQFVDANAGVSALAAARTDIDSYLTSVDEYEGGEKYEDLVFRIESSGKFLEYLILAILYDPRAFDEAMTKFARTRMVNYRRDCEKRGVVPSDVFRGLKDAAEIAWWTGSRMAFDDWYYRLWAQDVQGCLLLAKEYDRPRYDRDLKKFEEMVGLEKKGVREQAKGFKDFLRSLRSFEAARPTLKEANALYAKDRKAFFALYPDSGMEALKARSTELYGGIFYLSNPKDGKALMDGLCVLPPLANEWDPAKKEGDQKEFHKCLAYMEIFAPGKLQAGLQTLQTRVQPLLTPEFEYEKAREANPQMPSYKDAVRDIVNNDIHLKYFWLLKLIESPSKFEGEFGKLSLKAALEVSKWIDPARYSYLSDLAFMKEMIDRYSDSVPMLMDALIVDFGLYNTQLDKLKSWCTSKSNVTKNYRRGRKLADSLLKEPSNVLKALDKGLRQANRFALLAKNLQDFEEAVLSTQVANSMEDLRDEFDGGQRGSYAKHVESNNEKIRLDAGFTKKEWESLTKEFEKTPANAEWYEALSEGLNNRRLDCRKVQYPQPKDWQKEMF